jgi:cyanuric acid amidohydrolase
VIARAGSSGRSRAAAALGVALAHGEIDDADVDRVAIGMDHHVHARRAMTFSGTEVMHNEVTVLGNRPGAGGDLMAHAAPLSDILDTRSLKRLFREAGCGLDADGELTGTEKLRGVYLKAGVASDGLVRGERTTVFQSEVDPDKHMRAAASGLVGGLVGTTRVFVSGGAEHQAPPGGGLCVVIAEAPADAKREV